MSETTNMDSKEQMKKDLETLKIDESQDITKQYVTAKYKKLAKEIHPDRPGGVTSEFQELLNAYRRIIKHIEEKDEEDEEIREEDYETEFFKKHNFMKKCSSSYVVYILFTLRGPAYRLPGPFFSFSSDRLRQAF